MANHEWFDHEFPCGAFDVELYAGLLSLDTPMTSSSEWTNEIVEYAWGDAAAVDPSDPSKKLPWKTVEMIEAGNVPVPDYPPLVAEMEREEAKGKKAVMEDYYDDNGYDYKEEEVEVKGKKRVTKRGKQRRTPWTEEEHQLFLMGLDKYGKGDWRSISSCYVITKTPTQVASHAQKFFRRRNSCTPPDRRRPSIHDVQTVNPPFTAAQPPILPPFNPPPPVINPVHHTVYPFDRAAVFGQGHMFFEYALGDAAAVDPSDPTFSFFENVGKKLPWKTVEMIEAAGNVPVPDYPPLVAEMEREEAKGKNAVMKDYYDDNGYDYKEEEVEVNPPDRRLPSIHDFQTVNPPFTAAQPPIPPPFNYPPPPVINPVHHTVGPFDCAAVFGQDHMFMPPPLNAPPGFRGFPPPPPEFPNPFWN